LFNFVIIGSSSVFCYVILLQLALLVQFVIMYCSLHN